MRKPIGIKKLDRAHFTPAGGTASYLELAIADETDESQPSPAASNVQWPEAFGDSERYRIYGDPADGHRRMNIVIIPDGYTYAEKEQMEAHAETHEESIDWRLGYSQPS